MSIIATSTSTVGEPTGVDVAPHGLQAGYDGNEGKGWFYPPTANKGRLVIDPADNVGDYDTTIVNASMGQATIFTIPDPVAATAKYLLDTSVQQMAVGGAVKLDKAAGTESANAVTINKQSGVITTTSLTTAGGATETLTLTNSMISSSSVIMLQLQGGTNTTAGVEMKAVAGDGSAVITLTNLTAATAFNGTIIFGFSVF